MAWRVADSAGLDERHGSCSISPSRIAYRETVHMKLSAISLAAVAAIVLAGSGGPARAATCPAAGWTRIAARSSSLTQTAP